METTFVKHSMNVIWSGIKFFANDEFAKCFKAYWVCEETECICTCNIMLSQVTQTIKDIYQLSKWLK